MSELEEQYDGIVRRAQKGVEIELAEAYHLGRINGHDERGIILASARNEAFKEAAEVVRALLAVMVACPMKAALECMAEMIEAKIK